MENNIISLVIAVIALVVAVLSYFKAHSKDQKETQPVPVAENSFQTVPLQLQAYERLALLCERIAIPNLISRLSTPGASARQMQTLLIENIKQEFEYNTSQQIYISKIAWDSVRNLRDQSILIINQVANIMPEDATATDLNKQLLEVMLKHEDAALHSIVLDTISFEAKKLMRPH